ncbi:MAG TPA: hypothetical protein VE553_06285, partial [Candidatus Binatia bacterium]|nr:hypothetical protein [Candidatus Binatia bacterium]
MDYPLFRFFYWLINTPGLGGILATLLGVSSLTAYLLTLRWIKRGADANERETYAHPTPTLFGHE